MQTVRHRKIASHRLLLPDGRVLQMQVVTVVDGVVEQWHQLDGEQPMTEWLIGDIELRRDTDNRLRAYSEDRLLE